MYTEYQVCNNYGYQTVLSLPMGLGDAPTLLSLFIYNYTYMNERH